MIDELKKGIFTAFGATILSKQKIEEAIGKLVDESKLAEEDAKQLIDELAQTGEAQTEKIENNIRNLIEDTFENNTAGKEALHHLQQRVDGVEARISLLENKNMGNPGMPESRPVS